MSSPPLCVVQVRELGRGCFGSVWLARWRGVEVALKELLDQGATDCAPAEVGRGRVCISSCMWCANGMCDRVVVLKGGACEAGTEHFPFGCRQRPSVTDTRFSAKLQDEAGRHMTRHHHYRITPVKPCQVFSEAERLASLRHPCVIAFYGIVAVPGCYATVVEYMRMGSLKSGLTRLRKQVRMHGGEGWVPPWCIVIGKAGMLHDAS